MGGHKGVSHLEEHEEESWYRLLQHEFVVVSRLANLGSQSTPLLSTQREYIHAGEEEELRRKK